MKRVDTASLVLTVILLVIAAGAVVTAWGDEGEEHPAVQKPREGGPRARDERRERRRDGEKAGARERRRDGERAGAEERPRDGEKAGGEGRPRRARVDQRELIKELGLTEEQAAQFRQIMQDHHKAVQTWREQSDGTLREKRKAQREARRKGDEDAAKALQTEIKELQDQRQALQKELTEKLSTILTEEQVAKVKEAMKREGPRRPAGPLANLDLTEQQQAKVKAIRDEAEAQARKTENEEVRAGLRKEAMEKVIQTVLTPEQREKLKNAAPPRDGKGRRGPRPDLTDEQKEQSQAILKEAREKANAAETPEARGQIMQEARKKIFEDVLTDQQRAEAGRRRRGRGDAEGGDREGRARRRRGNRERNREGGEE